MPAAAARLQQIEDYLRAWQRGKPECHGESCATDEQIALADHALALIAQSQSKNGQEKKSIKIFARDILDTLCSKDKAKIRTLVHLLRWLSDETEFDDGGSFLDLKVSALSVLKFWLDESKTTSSMGHNPADLPEGWNGMDLRVIEENTTHSLQLNEGTIVRRSRGAHIEGSSLPVGRAIEATVHISGSSTQATGKGQLDDQIGAKVVITNPRNGSSGM